MGPNHCPQCNSDVNIVYDSDASSYVCTQCGIATDTSLEETYTTYNSRPSMNYSTNEDRANISMFNVENYIDTITSSLKIQKHFNIDILNTINTLFRGSLTKEKTMKKYSIAATYMICRQNKLPISITDVSNAAGITISKIYSILKKLRTSANEINMDSTIQAQDPSLLIKMVLKRMDILQGLDNSILLRIESRSMDLTQLARSEWLDTGRSPYGVIAASIRIACLASNIKTTFKQMCKYVGGSTQKISDRFNELKKEICLLIEMLPFTKSGDKNKDFKQYLVYTLDNLKDLHSCKQNLIKSSLHGNNKSVKRPRDHVVEPPAFVRLVLAKSDTNSRIERAKIRIAQDDHDDVILDRKDLLIEEKLRAGAEEKNILNGYFHTPVNIKDKERLDDEEIAQNEMETEELESYLKGSSESVELALRASLGEDIDGQISLRKLRQKLNIN
ncbi:transcription initiation factor IIB [Acrasis kona]|uniref:Transcription initiation factor IIB n=1 Tax=Acrasis kona TaxID=1008807 RepID=A0AAW2ZFH4_9EUKA